MFKDVYEFELIEAIAESKASFEREIYERRTFGQPMHSYSIFASSSSAAAATPKEIKEERYQQMHYAYIDALNELDAATKELNAFDEKKLMDEPIEFRFAMKQSLTEAHDTAKKRVEKICANFQ